MASAAAAMSAIVFAGCGDDKTGGMGVGGGGHGSPAKIEGVGWTELPASTLSFAGGEAPAAGGIGQAGGEVHLVSKGSMAVDPAAPAPALASAEVPAPPAGAMVLDPAALGADVAASGAVVIEGDVTSAGAEPVRRIATDGDLFVRGKLRGADLGSARQGFELSAGGGVYVIGSVDASGAAGGQAGGAVSIVAHRVVVTGKILTAGGPANDKAAPSAAGGPAGAVALRAGELAVVTGAIDASGGDARAAGDASGGAAGELALQVGGDLALGGTVLLRGGGALSEAGGAQGGAAARLIADSDATVQIGGIVDARGGLARSKTVGVAVTGGAAGSLRVGEGAPPLGVSILSALIVSGGRGDAAGGNGGVMTLEPRSGTLTIAGRLVLRGGDSLAAPGPGGTLSAVAGEQGKTGDAGGGLHVAAAAEIDGTGGSILMGGAGNGGSGATLTLKAWSDQSTLTIDAGAMIINDGGQSGGAGIAGGGGLLDLLTFNGALSMGGTLLSRGGKAPGAGGTGGLGGGVNLFTDLAHNFDGGNLAIEPSGLIDASGGEGAIGGSARNNGEDSSDVASFPDHQDQIAVLVNCDGVHGNTNNWLQNLGRIVARGGAANGWGGDIAFHGIAPDGNAKPPGGEMDIAGSGNGKPGQFRSE